MTSPPVILLDLDNTLYGNYPACNDAGTHAACSRLSTALSLPLSSVLQAYAQSREHVHARLRNTAASHSRFLYLQGCIEQLSGRTQEKLCVQAEHVFWEHFMDTMIPRAGLMQFLHEAKRKKRRVGIVSDLNARTQAMKITHLGIELFIEFLVTSEETGRDKPDPAIFLLALERLQTQAADTVMVGDDPAKDIAGAAIVGIPGIVIGDATAAPDIPRVHDFQELSVMLFA